MNYQVPFLCFVIVALMLCFPETALWTVFSYIALIVFRNLWCRR